MTKRIREKGEKVKQELLDALPQFKEDIEEATSPERLLRQDSSIYRMTDIERKARGLSGGKKRRRKRKKTKKRIKKKIKKKTKKYYKK